MLASVLSILYLAVLDQGMICGLGVKEFYNLSDITTCLRGTSSTLPDYGLQFYDALVAWQKINIYVDYSRDPTVPKGYTNPLPFGAGFDLLKEFETAKARFTSSGSDKIPLFDFYNELHKSLIKLRDGHVHALSPCLTGLSYRPPFDYKVLKNSSGSSVVPYFVITEVFGENTPSSLVGKVITALTWNGGENDKVPPPQAFSDWAEKYSDYGFSPHARFNHALIRLSKPETLYLSNNPLPDPATISLTVSAFSPDENGNPILSGAEENIQLEWLVKFIADVNDLSQFCPVVPPPPPSESSSSSSAFRPLTSLDADKQRIQDEILAVVEAYKRTLPGWRPLSGEHFSPDELKQRVGRQLERVQEHIRHFRRNRHRPSASKMAGANTKSNAVCDFSAVGTLNPTSNDLVVLCEDTGSKFNLTYIPALQLARMYIGGFNPDDLGEFGANLIGSVTTVNALKEDGVLKDLIVDVRSNGGGSDEATVLALNALFPNVVSDSEISVKLQDNNDQPGGFAAVFVSMYEDGLYTVGTDGTHEVVEDFTDEPVTEVFKNIAGVTPGTYTRIFTKPLMYKPDFTYDPDWPTLKLEPQHILLVSDGVVGSNGAVFAKKVRDSNAARVFGYSKYPGSSATYSLGSCPAIVVSTALVEQIRGVAPTEVVNILPPEPVTLDMSFAISLDREFSLNPARRGEILYLAGDTVDDIIPEFTFREYLSPTAVEAFMKTVHTKYILPPPDDDGAASILAVSGPARVCVWALLLGLVLWVVGM